MQSEEARLQTEIGQLLKQADVQDLEEDRQYGKAQRGDDAGHTRGPQGGLCKRTFGVPEDKAQDNFTDP